MHYHLLLSRCLAASTRRLYLYSAHTPRKLVTNVSYERITPLMAPRRKRTAAARANTPEPVSAGPAIVSSPEEAQALIRRFSTRKKRKVVYTEEVVAEGDDAEDVENDAGFESPLTELDDEAAAEEVVPKKKRTRRKKDIEPVVYDIPPVETKTTTFKGRLGYACLNTVLRALKPEPVFCSRTLRIDTILKPEFGMDYCKELGRRNAADLARLIQWNEENHIKFLRVSSEMFPFASHDKYGYTLEYAEKELKAAGDLAKRYGHRLTSHPGQFTQLGSPRDVVVDAAIRDLDYHCQMFRYMGLDQDSVMIIHMGGIFGDKQATIERFKEVYRTRLTDEMRARLVLENDEMCYNADDLLPVSEELNIPLVFDYHHNWIYPSELPIPELIERINAVWHRKGIKPKQHLSSPCPGAETVMEKRKHADRCYELPPELPDDMDLMIEAKDKEQAVFHLYRIYNLHPVVYENLRPEKPATPFPRMLKAQAAEAAANGEGEGDAGAATPRTRRTRSRTKVEEAPDALEVLETGVAEESKDLPDTAEIGDEISAHASTPGAPQAATKSPRKRTRKRALMRVEVEASESVQVEETVIPASPCAEPAPMPKKASRKRKAKGSQ
ncbi:UV-endonuclease UvdE-domain-containing protein [Trametes punicea]|nr:UV-endonuclease UvdE-domain-containing protein [Trametes punicea]